MLPIGILFVVTLVVLGGLLRLVSKSPGPGPDEIR
jgi:hypothetical protein